MNLYNFWVPLCVYQSELSQKADFNKAHDVMFAVTFALCSVSLVLASVGMCPYWFYCLWCIPTKHQPTTVQLNKLSRMHTRESHTQYDLQDRKPLQLTNQCKIIYVTCTNTVYIRLSVEGYTSAKLLLSNISSREVIIRENDNLSQIRDHWGQRYTFHFVDVDRLNLQILRKL